MDKKVDNSSKIDRQLTFEILLYLNIFYFSFYAGIEGLFLIIKFYHVEELHMIALLNEIFMLLMLCGIEAARLWLGQEDNLGKRVSVVFRILVLTVPSQYLTAYFTFWQTRVTQVDAVLGIVLLVIQTVQLICAFLTCLPNKHRICFNPFELNFDKLHWCNNNSNWRYIKESHLLSELI